MGGRIYDLAWLCLAVPGANTLPATKGNEIEKQEDNDSLHQINSPHGTLNDNSQTNTDSDSDTEKDVAVQRAFITENVAETTRKTSLSLQQDKTNDKKIYTQTFGSPGPPYRYHMDNTDELKNDTSDPIESKSDLQLQTGEPFVVTGTSKRQNMQNISVQYQHQAPSLSTLSQDDMTMDAVMGRPPRLTEAGRRLQREQEERERARQQTERALHAEKSPLQMKKEDTFLLSASVPREKPEQTFNLSKPTTGHVTEIQRSILMDTKSKLEKAVVKVKPERDEDMVKFIKDLARSVTQPAPSVKYFDAAVVYDKNDYEEVKDFIDELKLMTATELKQELRIELFDSEEFAQSMVMVISDVIDRCSVVFVYLTDNSNTDLIRLFCDEAVGLSRLGLNDPGVVPGRHARGRQWMLKPVHTQPLKYRQYQTPVGLLTLTGLDWYDWPSLFVRDRAKSILSSAIANRKSKETTQNISNKYDSAFGSTPIEFESNESLKIKLGLRDPTTSLDALSFNAAHSLKPLPGASAQNGQHNRQFLFPQDTPGKLSNPVDPQQRYRNSYSQQPQERQFQHQTPVGYRPMLNATIPSNNSINIQGQPRMQLFNPSPQDPRSDKPLHNSGPHMHQMLTTTLHPSSLYQDQLSYRHPYDAQNTNLDPGSQSSVVSGQLWNNREYATHHNRFEQNSHRDQDWCQHQTRHAGAQNILGGNNQNKLPDKYNHVTNREVLQQDNGVEQNFYRDQDWCGQQTRLNVEPNMPDAHQRYRFASEQNVPRAHHQNRITGEYGLQGASRLNSAEYGSLMIDPRHDTPPSSELTVVSKLTGKLITNPDLSNGDLEIDGDRNPDTLPLMNGDINTPEADVSDSSDEDDDDADSDYEDSLREIFSGKGKVLNIFGSKVVQLGRDNQSFEQYITKDKHKGNDNTCTTVKGKGHGGSPPTPTRNSGCNPTIQTNIKHNARASDDDSSDKRYSPIELIKNDFWSRDEGEATFTNREAQRFEGDSVDMRPSYLDESTDIKPPNLNQTSNSVVGQQPRASKLSNTIDRAGQASGIRDTIKKKEDTGVSVHQDELINDLDRYESLEDNSSYFDGSGQNTRKSRKTFPNRHDKPTSDSPAQFAFTAFRTSIFTKLTSIPNREQLGGEVGDFGTDLD